MVYEQWLLTLFTQKFGTKEIFCDIHFKKYIGINYFKAQFNTTVKSYLKNNS